MKPLSNTFSQLSQARQDGIGSLATVQREFASPIDLANEGVADAAAPTWLVEQVPFSWLIEHERDLASLMEMQSEPTPFQTIPWLFSWWESYGRDYAAHILTVRRNGELAAVLPLMALRSRAITVLEWLGAGRSDHAPMLIRPDSQSDCLKAAISFLHNSPIRWSLLSLRTLQESQCQSLLQCLPPGGYLLEQDDVSPRVVVHGDWEEYLGRKTRKHRTNIKRLLKRAEDTPLLTVSCERQFRSEALAEIADLERRSWKAQEGSLRLEGDGRKFYEAFLSRLAERGHLELWFCRYDGFPLAYLITFNYRDTVFYYNGAYRSDYETFCSAVSPGSLLVASAIKSAIDRGLKAFDFLRGDEPYKKLWINEDRRLHHLVVRGRGIRGWLAELVSVRLRWWLRRYPLAGRVRSTLQRWKRLEFLNRAASSGQSRTESAED